MQSAFGCGFEGQVPEERVLEMVRAYVGAGFRSISLADTAGHAPRPGGAALRRVFGTDPTIEAACHFHNTYGLGMANLYAALRAGVTSFETSFAGLGGCPFTRVAAGNVATEDFVHALHLDGRRLDVNLDRLIELARGGRAPDADLPGFVYKTGPMPVHVPA